MARTPQNLVPFKKGDDPRRNIAGRPKGAKDFITKWNAMVEKLASQNNTTIDEIDEQLLLVAFKKAKDGDFNFYKDVMDRKHGQAVKAVDITSGGEKIGVKNDPEAQALAREYEEKLKEKL